MWLFNKTKRLRHKIEKLLGTEYFLYPDDRAFIISDMIRYPTITKALQNDITASIYQRLKDAVAKSPVIATVFGPPLSGRDALALEIATLIAAHNKPLLDSSKHEFIIPCFTHNDIHEAIQTAQPYDILIFDVRPATIHPDKLTSESVANLRRTLLGKHLNFIGICDYPLNVEVSLQFETLGYKLSSCDHPPTSYRTLVRGGRNGSLCGVCYFDVVIPPDISKRYEAEKMCDIDSLFKAGGMEVLYTAQQQSERLQKDSKKVLDYIKKNALPISPYPSRRQKCELGAIIALSGVGYNELGFDSDYRNTLIAYVALLMRMEPVAQVPKTE